MPEQLIGLSLSSCIRFILEHEFPADRIAKIICGGQGQSDEAWENRIDLEKNKSANPTRFRLIAEQLRHQGKLLFPAENCANQAPVTSFGCWTTSDDSVISASLYTAAFDEFNALSRQRRIHSHKVIESEFNALSNRIYWFDNADIQAIRAKHEPSIRKAIAQFFGG